MTDQQYEYSEEDALYHYGVLGMKWGVRKDRLTGKVRARATRSRGDVKREKKRSFTREDPRVAVAKNRISRRSARRVRAAIKTVNRKYSEQTFTFDSPARRQYYSEIATAVSAQLNASATRTKVKGYGRNKTLRFVIDPQNPSNRSVFIESRGSARQRKITREAAKNQRKRAVSHEDDGESTKYPVDITFNSKGLIEDILFPEEVMQLIEEEAEHAEALVEHILGDANPLGDALEHYGVLGMKWGVRKDRRTGQPRGSATAGTSAAKRKNSGNRVEKTIAPKPKSAPRPQAKKEEPSPTQSSSQMSAEQMRAEIARIKLEREYRQLTAAPPSTKQKLLKFAADTVQSVAATQVKRAMNNMVQKQADDFLVKHGLMDPKGKKGKDNAKINQDVNQRIAEINKTLGEIKSKVGAAQNTMRSNPAPRRKKR